MMKYCLERKKLYRSLCEKSANHNWTLLMKNLCCVSTIHSLDPGYRGFLSAPSKLTRRKNSKTKAVIELCYFWFTWILEFGLDQEKTSWNWIIIDILHKKREYSRVANCLSLQVEVINSYAVISLTNLKTLGKYQP